MERSSAYYEGFIAWEQGFYANPYDPEFEEGLFNDWTMGQDDAAWHKWGNH